MVFNKLDHTFGLKMKVKQKISPIHICSDHQVHLFHEHSSVQVHSTKLELSSVQVQYFSGDNN